MNIKQEIEIIEFNISSLRIKEKHYISNSNRYKKRKLTNELNYLKQLKQDLEIRVS